MNGFQTALLPNAVQAAQTLWTPLSKAALLRQRQSHNLRALVRHAAQQVPYYRTLFAKAGIRPESIQCVEDLQRIPITDKSDLRKLPLQERIPEGVAPGALHVFNTSGTTGRPLDVAVSKRDHMINRALMLRVLHHYGMKPWHSKMSIKGAAVPAADRSWHARLGLYRRGWISATLPPEEWVRGLDAFKPDYLLGYFLTLQLMARALKEAPGAHARPRCILSTSGVLGAAARSTIADGFGAPVLDVYASWEGGIMAWECRDCGAYHVNSDQVIIEVLRDGRPVAPGEEGEAVITNLHSRGMPIIRYRQGDVLVRGGASPCRCVLPTLQAIHGRTADAIRLPSGRTMTPHGLMIIIDHIPGIERWRLVQPDPARIRIQLVHTDAFDAAAAERLRRKLGALLKEDVAIVLEPVQDLPYAPNEKYRLVVSEAP
jgi:phenylacetate-CoA ligase